MKLKEAAKKVEDGIGGHLPIAICRVHTGLAFVPTM